MKQLVHTITVDWEITSQIQPKEDIDRVTEEMEEAIRNVIDKVAANEGYKVRPQESWNMVHR